MLIHSQVPRQGRVMGIHVDDTAVGGTGPGRSFPFRKWRVGNGDFCGALYEQCTKTKDITMSQQSFAESLRPASIPSTLHRATNQSFEVRAINGSLNWLSSQSLDKPVSANKGFLNRPFKTSGKQTMPSGEQSNIEISRFVSFQVYDMLSQQLSPT